MINKTLVKLSGKQMASYTFKQSALRPLSPVANGTGFCPMLSLRIPELMTCLEKERSTPEPRMYSNPSLFPGNPGVHPLLPSLTSRTAFARQVQKLSRSWRSHGSLSGNSAFYIKPAFILHVSRYDNNCPKNNDLPGVGVTAVYWRHTCAQCEQKREKRCPKKPHQSQTREHWLASLRRDSCRRP